MIKIERFYYLIGLVITVPFVNLRFGYFYLRQIAIEMSFELNIPNYIYLFLFVGSLLSLFMFPILKKFINRLDKQILYSTSLIIIMNFILLFTMRMKIYNLMYFALISIFYQIVIIYYFGILVKLFSKKISEPLDIKLIMLFFTISLLIIMILIPSQINEITQLSIPALSTLYLVIIVNNFDLNAINVSSKISFEMKKIKGPIFIVLMLGLIGFSRAIEHLYLINSATNSEVMVGNIAGLLLSAILLIVTTKIEDIKIREWTFAFLISITALSEFFIVVSLESFKIIALSLELASFYTWMIFVPIIIGSITRIARSPIINVSSVVFVWSMNFAGFCIGYIFSTEILLTIVMFPIISAIGIFGTVYSKYLRPPISIFGVLVYSNEGDLILSIPKESQRNLWPIVKTTMEFFKDSNKNISDYGILFNNEYVLSRKLNGYIITIITDRESKELKEYFTDFVDTILEQYTKEPGRLNSIIEYAFEYFFLTVMNE